MEYPKITLPLLILAALSVLAPQHVIADVEKLAMANNAFAWKFYYNLVTTDANDTKNVFFSPLSISLGYAMVYAGAGGDTKTQMDEVMRFADVADTEEEMHQAYNDIRLIILKNPTNIYVLELASKLFGQKDIDYKPEFLEIIKTQYGAALDKVDFANDASLAVEHINDWVEEVTEMKIKDLVSEDDITKNTLLGLVNAVFFNALWKEGFNKNDTEERPFFLNATDSIDVNMMYMESNLSHAFIPSLKSDILTIPYTGDTLSMYVLLPKERDGIVQLQEALRDYKPEDLFKERPRKRVKVTLPKFHFEKQIDLNKTLSMMGMGDLFDSEKADLSSMSENQNLFLFGSKHKAIMCLNENGKKEAATKVNTRGNVEEPLFMADHPFIFFIVDERTGAVVFMGRLVEPMAMKPIGAGPALHHSLLTLMACGTLLMTILWQ